MDAEPITPRDILYRAVERYLNARASPMSHDESAALAGLMSIVAQIEDEAYADEIERIKTEGHEPSWETFTAIIGLLHRKNLWLRPPRGVIEGEELLESID